MTTENIINEENIMVQDMNYYVDENGNFMGGFDDHNDPRILSEWTQIEDQPIHGLAILVNNVWDYSAAVRSERDQLLLEVDPIVSNPLRWSSMTAEKQAEWSTYRQALLDVPSQAGFPDNIEWPTKPE